MTADPKTTAELTTDWIRRVVTYSSELTYFGEDSPAHALGLATAQQTQLSENQYRALIRRQTLMGSTGTALVNVAEEYGTPKRGAARSQVLVILRPWSTTVTAISAGAKIEVEDSSKFEAGDSIRLVSADGSTTELLTIGAILTATGPNGGDELSVGTIVGTYEPSTETVTVLLRVTKPAGTVLTSTAGISFASLDPVTTGDSNPVLTGESESLGLADKVWAEAVTAGAAGNVEAQTVTGLQTPDPDIRAILNPSRGHGGVDEEPDYELKYRASHQPQIGAIETSASLEALARRGNSRVLRAFRDDSGEISTLGIRVLTRSGGGLSADEREALALYMADRMRSENSVVVRNVILTSIEVIASITLAPGVGTPAQRLKAAWKRAADSLATFLDYRKWPAGTLVDEADLLTIVKTTRGISGLTTSSFLPSADTEVSTVSVPTLARFVLTDTASLETFGAVLSTTY